MAYTTVNKSSEHFNTKIYTGNQSSTHALTGVGFKPDLTWLKIRSGTGSHYLYDAIRGVTKSISSDTSSAELTNSYFSSFNTDGFTLGSASNNVNGAYNYASWNWKAGTTSGITTDSYTTITPTAYSFNATAGFSIIKYVGNGTTGAKYPHGLGVAPKMVIVKNLGTTDWWNVHHASLGNNSEMYLNTANAAPSSTGNGTTPDAVNIELEGTTNTHNASGNNYIAYCFRDVIGYSKFGSYIGNGNADGTFVYTGFKPAWIMIKNSNSSSEEWNIWDNKRNTFNVMTTRLVANINGADSVTSAGFFDFTSNGFKIRSTANGVNQSGNKMIYMCFAEAPLVGTNNVPCTAR